MLDAVAEAGQNLAEVDLGAAMPNGGPVASGRRASKLGTGGPGLGFGPGDGGVPAEQRWSIVYNPGQTPEEYARQLDALASSWPSSRAATSSPTSRTSPTRRRPSGTARGRGTTGSISSGKGGAGRRPTSPCLQKAGIDVGEGVVLQFYPKPVEQQLAQLEVRYHGPAARRDPRHPVQRRPPGRIRYGFEVLAQETAALTGRAATRLHPNRTGRRPTPWPPWKSTTVKAGSSA